MIKTLICTACRVEFTYDHRKGPTRHWCDACTIVRARERHAIATATYRARDPQRAKDQANKSNRKRLADPEHLRWKREDAMRRAYGLEPADYDQILATQGGRCAICGGGPNGPGRRLHVDHCHDSKRVRGLLCAKCNTAVGLLNDDPERADLLAAYLRR